MPEKGIHFPYDPGKGGKGGKRQKVTTGGEGKGEARAGEKTNGLKYCCEQVGRGV